MRSRKLQIFVSSTYEDLIDQRLAAMEAILAAGHIPAAMEQFSPGDETAWERIKTWIDQSDAFLLILGGRYGSIEPVSGKSYVQLEYEYAAEKKKPFFALVVSDRHHEERVKAIGLQVDERERPQPYREFKALVTGRLCGFWSDRKDIKLAIMQKLPEWAERPELVGWVRGNEASTAETMNELARLSRENSELRTRAVSFDGLSVDELSALLPDGSVGLFMDFSHRAIYGGPPMPPMPRLQVQGLVEFGLLELVVDEGGPRYRLTDSGRRFRNRLLAQRHPKSAKDTPA